MKVIESTQELQQHVNFFKGEGGTLGFVPTMGALHEGHLRLFERARRECDRVVISIFVNPLQFGPQEDYARYPRPKERDLTLCERQGVDLVFYPSSPELYPDGFCTYVEVRGLSDKWEGAIRPGHFRGVTTVVAKLFHLVQPTKAYFGQKDYQQLTILRRMVQDLHFPLEIVMCPTVREPDGLAMSSRNAYLSAEERQRAVCLYQSLMEAERALRQGERRIEELQRMMAAKVNSTAGVLLDYATIVDPHTLVELHACQSSMVALIAARLGTTRLIDNAIWNI